jgi:hypothetical protein
MSEDKFKVGDLVLVLDPGLALLRQVMPDMPPNHHGVIEKARDQDGDYLIKFPIGDDDPEEHSQVAPYPEYLIRLRKE